MKKTKQEKVHKDFLAFVKHVWPEFIEGKHHKKISEKFNKLAKGEIKRLIINMPPRHTKVRVCIFLATGLDGGPQTRFKNNSNHAHH